MARAWRACLALIVASACVRHAETPKVASGAACACRAHAPKQLDRSKACGRWSSALGPEDEYARSHVSFPELDPKSCLVRVRYENDKAKADPIPDGCGYPHETTFAKLDAEAAHYEEIVSGAGKLPLDLACSLPTDERARAARMNAATLRATAKRAKTNRWPYAATSTFGYGAKLQTKSGLAAWRPGDACPTLDLEHMRLLEPNVLRAGRAAEAYHAHVSPVVTVSGGAIHSPLYETWVLTYLLTCRFSVPLDAILVDPCADHTHTNVRNTGSLVIALGGRTAYVVTDGLQSGYLQEWTSFDLIGGSIDQRSLRDFGYLVGAYRQASVGALYGFWLTPYRFWAANDDLATFTCVR